MPFRSHEKRLHSGRDEVGAPDSADTQALLSVVRDRYRPFQVVALEAPDAQSLAVPLLQECGLVDGQAAAYVCDAPVPGHAFACQEPVTEPEPLCHLLDTG